MRKNQRHRAENSCKQPRRRRTPLGSNHRTSSPIILKGALTAAERRTLFYQVERVDKDFQNQNPSSFGLNILSETFNVCL
jgi:hypothetical protein